MTEETDTLWRLTREKELKAARDHYQQAIDRTPITKDTPKYVRDGVKCMKDGLGHLNKTLNEGVN